MKATRPRARILVAGLAASVAAAGIIAATGPLSAHAASAAPRHGAAPYARTHEIDILGIGHRYRITANGTVHAGLAKIAFTSAGPEPHQAQLFLLNVPFARFKHDLLTSSPAAIGADALPWGGAAITLPGQTQVVYQALQGGTYAVVCFVRGADGVPHFAMGMISSFSVAGHLSTRQLAALRPGVPVAGAITGHDMTYTVPAVLHSGRLYRFTDTDKSDAHELNIARLLPGKTVKDVIAWAAKESGPAPFVPWGGAGALLPHGLSTWFQLTAAPGRYVAFCLVPDDKTHLPHAAMGMVVEFVVR